MYPRLFQLITKMQLRSKTKSDNAKSNDAKSESKDKTPTKLTIVNHFPSAITDTKSGNIIFATGKLSDFKM